MPNLPPNTRVRRVLMVSPHFPPDTTAATHRVRLLAPHLPQYGWEPTVITVDPRDYEGRLDPDLAALVPSDLRVVRCRALSARWTRVCGIGDLALRAITGIYRTCRCLLQREHFDALFITMYPTYTALLGPLLKRRFAVSYVLDYQDPWVGAWGLHVGGGRNGTPDLRSRLSRMLALRLEPLALHRVDAITAVSAATYEAVRERYATLRRTPCTAIPIGGEPADFDYLRTHPRANAYFDSADGNVHVCYVGTLLPLGVETLYAVLRAAALLRTRQPQLYNRLRLRFFGTSNQTVPDVAPRVLPIARELGIADCVSEVAPRIDYLDALTVLTQASAILLLGSSERHYTPSKLYPGLLAKRPLLAVYHEQSDAVRILRRTARDPRIQVITYDDQQRASSRVEDIAGALGGIIDAVSAAPVAFDLEPLADCSARHLAGRLADVLNDTCRC